MARLRHWNEILALRLQAQGLSRPLKKSQDYLTLFRALGPIEPQHATRPGNPPILQHRTVFDDLLVADVMRSERKIIKGRFQGGGIAYVAADEISLYGTVFGRPLKDPTETDERVLEAIKTEGPFSPRQIKEATGILVKDVTKSLHKLSRAFLVYEDQVDDDWGRGFYDFSAEWPGTEITDYETGPETWLEAASEVLMRFINARIFAEFQEIRDWSGLPIKRLKEVLARLEAEERLENYRVTSLGEGWSSPDVRQMPPPELGESIHVLHKGDPLCRAEARVLKGLFGQIDTLQYILMDGQFSGAVVGRWGINPFDVDDIQFLRHIPARDINKRKDEIVEKVQAEYPEPRHNVLRFMGEKL